MVAEILAGAAMTFGAWGVVLQWDKRKNGSAPAPEAGPLPETQTHTVVIPGLEELPQKIEQGQIRAMESLIGRLEPPHQDPWLSEQVAKSLADIMSQPREIVPPPPEWANRIESDLAENDKRLARIASDIAENLTDGMTRFYGQISQDLLRAMPQQPSAPPPELAASLERIAERMEAAAQAIPAQRVELAESLRDEVDTLLSSVRSRIAKLPPPPPAAGSGHGGDPPPRRAAPPLPRVPSSGTPLVTPQIPAPYVAGTVWTPAGQVANLLELIQQQLQPNCPGSAAEFRLAADSANADPVMVGAASALGGPLTADNYAYELTAATPPRVYRSTYPGNSTPIGELQVLAASASALHVEVQA